MPGGIPSTACTATTCATSIPRVPASIDVRNMSCETLWVGSRSLVEPRDRITSSSDGPSTTGTLTGGAEGHGDPSASRSPARCAAVTSGNSTGATSTCPATAGPVAARAGDPPPIVTSATGHSWTPSAPTSVVTSPSGNLVVRAGANPADAAAASSCESIVPASQ